MSDKARPFSIFLLKDGFDPSNALNEGHSLTQAVEATNIPQGSTLYILDNGPTPPWWKSYFGILENLSQVTKGALLFIPVNSRYFALSFGHVFHHLNDYSYEYDFGLIVTLNSLDPAELKSADMVSPGAARRKRTQVPVSTDLTYLDFDGNSEIIKSLTGKVKEEYIDLFKNATGATSLKISLKLDPDELTGICEKLLDLYGQTYYRETFPNIQNIAPLRDPEKVDELNAQLLVAFHAQDDDIVLTIPDVVDYRDNTCCIFKGVNGESSVYPDITLGEFFAYLNENNNHADITVDKLRQYKLVLTDIDGNPSGKSYNIFRCLVFEIQDTEKKLIYHLCEGNWYKVEQSYADRLKAYLDDKCEDNCLCEYNHDSTKDGKSVYSEENYNKAVNIWNGKYICLDQKDISPQGSTQIEPCDLYCVEHDSTAVCQNRAHFFHVKISTRSAHLSHLFNQGLNSVELIELEKASKEKMKQLILDNIGANDETKYIAPLAGADFKVIFGIITHKDKNNKSDNLPLFSKISLMRCMQRLDLMKIPTALMFIDDQSPHKNGYPKYDTVLAEICIDDKGKKVICVVGDNDKPDMQKHISRCQKIITEGIIGARYNISVKEQDDGKLSSYHKWPYQAVTMPS